MRAVCFQATECVTVQELPDPQIENPLDAIVEVEIAGLCGSDLHPFFGRETGLDPGTAMGHEFVGRVIEVGDAVRTIETGDRVAAPFTTNCGECFYCQRGLTSRCDQGQLFGWRSGGEGLHGGQAERVRVPLADGTLVRLPENANAETTLLLGDNLSTAWFGLEMATDVDGRHADTLVVVGCGTVGLLSIALAKAAGVENLFAVDPNRPRLLIAEQLGASVFEDSCDAIDNVRSATDNRGADAVMEFVGLPDAQRLAYDLVRPGGRLSVIGCHCTPGFAFSPSQAYDKNLTYRTGRCPARHYMSRLPDLLSDRPVDLSWCFTHRFGIDDAVEAYQTFAYRNDGCVKALLDLT